MIIKEVSLHTQGCFSTQRSPIWMGRKALNILSIIITGIYTRHSHPWTEDNTGLPLSQE